LRHDRKNAEAKTIYFAPLRELVFHTQTVHHTYGAQTEVCATNYRRFGAQITSHLVNVGAEFPEFPQGPKPILSKLRMSGPFVPLGKLKLRPAKPIYETSSKVCAPNHAAGRVETSRLISIAAASA
jgi:hypothetical protein